MSEPQRYTLALPDISYGMDESNKGEYVLWRDYAKLKAEVERLNAVIESHKDAGLRLLAMLSEERLNASHIKAEVERLKKEKELPFAYGGKQLLVDLNKLLTAHRRYCDVNAIDYRQMEKDALS